MLVRRLVFLCNDKRKVDPLVLEVGGGVGVEFVDVL